LPRRVAAQSYLRGVYWQLQRYYHDRTRNGIDQTSIVHGAVVRLKRLHPPNREAPALAQLVDALSQIENLSADAAYGDALPFEGFLQSLKSIGRAMQRPDERIVALPKRMLAPGCVDIVLGRSWRNRQKGATA